MFDKVSGGDPAVVIDKSMFKEDGSVSWEPFIQNIGQNYIVDKLLADMRKIESMFDTAIGIPNANTDKRERLISSEVEANDVETKTLCELWLETLQEGIQMTKDMFSVDLSVQLRHEEGGEDDEPIRDNESAGTV